MSEANVCCRSCGCRECKPVLDLGMQPLANNLLRKSDLGRKEPFFPLNLVVCPDCWLLQISETVPPTELFTQYLYFSSFSETMLDHARTAVDQYRARFDLGHTSFVVEIASNDGYLLQYVQQAGIPCLGIEPAANIAEVARTKGIPTETEFFSASFAENIVKTRRQADLILGNNVFAHVPQINDFVSGMRRLLAPGGRIVLEFPYALDCVQNCEFDTIYHEHVFYYLLTPLIPLFRRHELEVCDVERLPIHGGSLRLFVAHRGDVTPTPAVGEMLDEEKRVGAMELPFYSAFAARVQTLRTELVDFLRALRKSGRRLAGYGASAKGSTLLNFAGIGPELIPYLVDRSEHKQNLLSPGRHIPIYAPEHLLADQPDYTLLLTWNFEKEILRQQADYRDRGGKFIIPIPNVRTV